MSVPPTNEGGSYRLLFEFLIEADGYPMAEDLGEKIVEHLPLPGWVDEVKFVGVQVDDPEPREELDHGG